MLSGLEEEQTQVKQRNAKLFCRCPVVCYKVYFTLVLKGWSVTPTLHLGIHVSRS